LTWISSCSRWGRTCVLSVRIRAVSFVPVATAYAVLSCCSGVAQRWRLTGPMWLLWDQCGAPALVRASTLSCARPLPVLPRGRDGGEVASPVWLRQEKGSWPTLTWVLVWRVCPSWVLVIRAVVNTSYGPRGLLTRHPGFINPTRGDFLNLLKKSRLKVGSGNSDALITFLTELVTDEMILLHNPNEMAGLVLESDDSWLGLPHNAIQTRC
jgi:hypothetical protein